MEKESVKKENEEKKDMFTSDHGFVAMQKWPDFLRWILVLPVALISFVFVNGMSNWALKISDAPWFIYFVSFIFHTLASALFIYYGAATAPKGRKVVMMILTVILLASAVLIFILPQDQYNYVDLSYTLKIINALSVVLGIAIVYFGWVNEKVNIEK